MFLTLQILPIHSTFFCLIAHISNSSVGAASPILGEAVKRISSVLNSKEEEGTAPYDLYEATVRHSFVLSSDQAHALHPNYASKHEKSHQPQMNAGMVIKRNANQRYATTGPTGILMREIARRSNLPPIQEFMVRQDCGCVRSLVAARCKLASPLKCYFANILPHTIFQLSICITLISF
jgi:aspartyl aminopeptidase